MIQALMKSHPDCFQDKQFPPLSRSLIKDPKDTNFPRWRYLDWKRISFHMLNKDLRVFDKIRKVDMLNGSQVFSNVLALCKLLCTKPE
jgi:hypothetical protein